MYSVLKGLAAASKLGVLHSGNQTPEEQEQSLAISAEVCASVHGMKTAKAWSEIGSTKLPELRALMKFRIMCLLVEICPCACLYVYVWSDVCMSYSCMYVRACVLVRTQKCVDACLGFYSRRKKGEPCTDVSGTLVALEDLEPRPKPALRRFLLSCCC